MEREGPVFCAGGRMLETPLAEFSIGSSAKNGRFQAIYRRLFFMPSSHRVKSPAAV